MREVEVDTRSRRTIRQVHRRALERGFGVTLANALRAGFSLRSGRGRDAVKIDGVQHEFTTMPGSRRTARVLLN